MHRADALLARLLPPAPAPAPAAYRGCDSGACTLRALHGGALAPAEERALRAAAAAVERDDRALARRLRDHLVRHAR